MKRVTNFIEMNSNIFKKLYGFMSGYPRKYDREPRWIKLSDEEKETCNNLYLKDSLVMDNGVISCLLEKEGERFFAIIGEDIGEVYEHELFKPMATNKIHFLRIVSDLDIQPISNISPYMLEETVLFYNKDTDGYDGHDSKIIQSYFPDIKLFSLNTSYSLYSAPLENLTGYFLCEYSESLEIFLGTDAINLFKDIFHEEFDTLNYNTLLRSFSSNYHKDIFMEIYRCIEYLYRAIAVKDIQLKMCTTLDIIQTYEIITNDLNYRLPESNSISIIFEGLSNDLKKIIISIDEENILEGKEDEWFYNVRNSLVHGRRKDKEIKFTLEQWIMLITVSLRILIDVNTYAKNNNLTSEPIHRIQKN